MKIYFEDGELRLNDIGSLRCSDCFYDIDAGSGVSACYNSAMLLLTQNNPNIIIYTNCLELFSNRFAWNEDLKVPEIYIRHKDTWEFIRIDEATPRVLREGHNLAKMYLAGEFDLVSKALNCPPVINLNK